MTELPDSPNATELVINGRNVAVFELSGAYNHARLLAFFKTYKQQAEQHPGQIAVIDIRRAQISGDVRTVMAGKEIQQLYAAQVVLGTDKNPTAAALIHTLDIFRGLTNVLAIATDSRTASEQLAAGKRPIYLVPRDIRYSAETTNGAAVRIVGEVLAAASAEG